MRRAERENDATEADLELSLSPLRRSEPCFTVPCPAQVGAIEEQLHVAEGAALSQEHFNSLLDLLQTCSNRARTMEQAHALPEAIQGMQAATL